MGSIIPRYLKGKKNDGLNAFNWKYEMKQYIPKNFDVDELVSEYPPDSVTNFNRDRLITIVSSVSEKKPNDSEFTPLASKYLQKKAHNYKEYLDYLSNTTSTIDIDKQFRYGDYPSKVRGYKFTSEYETIVKAVEEGRHIS